MYGDQGQVQEAKDSVVLIVGTENYTEIIVEPLPTSQLPTSILRRLEPVYTLYYYFSVQQRTVTI